MLALLSRSNDRATDCRWQKRDILFDAILEHREVGQIEVEHISVGAVGHGDVQRHDVHAATKGRSGRRRLLWG